MFPDGNGAKKRDSKIGFLEYQRAVEERARVQRAETSPIFGLIGLAFLLVQL
jgi:hypothetical protein